MKGRPLSLFSTSSSTAPPMAPLCAGVLLCVLCVWECVGASNPSHVDHGGVSLWSDRLLGEPSVMSLNDRLDPQWYQANNPESCPEGCFCPIQWPTALYCDQRALPSVPADLPGDTQYLFLQRNNISSLPSSVLAEAPALRWLIVDQNQLEGELLEGPALQNHTELRYLYANHNRLTAVPQGLPEGLRQLRLAYNRISSLGADAFQHLQHLTVLLLQGNRLQTVPSDSFTGLLALDLLDLGENRFKAVPAHLPPSLQQLYLSGNNFSELGEGSFAGLDRLKYLRLSRCGLRSPGVPRTAFNVSTLVELDLSYNRLAVTPTVPNSLQYLYLEANEIQEFKVSSFCQDKGPLSYSRMRILRLDGNKMSYSQLPVDWVYCLRVLHNIFI
ncbi:unnamed protein product [Gadus morhua 'NCC']